MTQLSMLNPDGSVSDLVRARQQRDDGIDRAARHAESDYPGWGSQALAYLRRYAENHDCFMGWFVTNESELSGSVPAAPTRKSWGAIFTKAVRLGWIEKDGYRQDPNRHCNPAPVWRSLICRP